MKKERETLGCSDARTNLIVKIRILNYETESLPQRGVLADVLLACGEQLNSGQRPSDRPQRSQIKPADPAGGLGEKVKPSKLCILKRFWNDI